MKFDQMLDMREEEQSNQPHAFCLGLVGLFFTQVRGTDWWVKHDDVSLEHTEFEVSMGHLNGGVWQVGSLSEKYGLKYTRVT